jgi:hypothetical protein
MNRMSEFLGIIQDETNDFNKQQNSIKLNSVINFNNRG